MTAAVFPAAHAAADAAPMDLGPHESAGVPGKKSAAESAADAATAARDKSKNDAKHGKKSKTSKADARDDRVDAKDAKDAKLSPVERCEKRIRAAKRATRSELSVSGGEWAKNGYAGDPDVLSTSLFTFSAHSSLLAASPSTTSPAAQLRSFLTHSHSCSTPTYHWHDSTHLRLMLMLLNIGPPVSY